MSIFGLFKASQQPEPQQNINQSDDDWLAQIPGYSELEDVDDCPEFPDDDDDDYFDDNDFLEDFEINQASATSYEQDYEPFNFDDFFSDNWGQDDD